jgi:hypothetical protein
MSDTENRWILPDTKEIDSPLFVGGQERDFVKQVGDEIAENILNQTIIYYGIDFENTKYHPVYGEAIKKTFYPPIKMEVPVEWKGETTTGGIYSLDKRPQIIIYFPQRRITQDLELQVREGDFVQYGRDFYEIINLNEDKELFGTFNYRVEIIATCIKARQGMFNA